MSLLTIVQAATDRIGIPRPAQVMAASDPQTRILAAMATEEGREQARRHNWQVLTKEATFTTVAAEEQGSLLANFSRFIEGSMWNRTQNRPVVGPLSPQRFQQLKATVSASVWDSFYIRGNKILFNPTPAAGETIAYEYCCKYWCRSSGDSVDDQEAWAADEDITSLDEDLMSMGVHWRFLRARRLDYAEEFRLYEAEFVRRASEDGGMKILDLGDPGLDGIMSPYFTDGSWNV